MNESWSSSENKADEIVQFKEYLELDESPNNRPLTSIHRKGEFEHGIQYWLSCLGSAVGYGNIWRFPYVLFDNGGGAFFIPYFICIILIVFPLYYVETAYGQLYRKPVHRYYSSIKAKFIGLSFTIALVGFFTAIFLSTLLAWGINLLILSFSSTLPWEADKDSKVFWKDGYFQNEFLHSSKGIGDINYIVPWIGISFVISAILNYLTIFKSIKSVGVAVFVMIPLPYILLCILFIRGITLDGFYEGWVYLFNPDWSKLLTFKIWKDAGAQVIFSCTLGVNIMILFASHREKEERILPAAIGIPAMNFATSIFAAMTLFSFLGYASVSTGVPISEMPVKGIELAFVVYPALITTLPFSQLWAVLFFVMLICLGLSSQFPYYEVCITFIHGLLEDAELKGIGKPLLYLIFGTLILVINLGLFATDAGIYWFELFNHYVSGLNLLIILLVQTLILGWSLDLETLEERVKFNKETIPFFLTVLVALGIIDEFTMPLDEPFWGYGLGAVLGVVPLSMIFLGGVKSDKADFDTSDMSIYKF